MYRTLLAVCAAGTCLYIPYAEAKPNWADSFSSGGKCYCDSNFDHGLDGMQVDTPQGKVSIKEACKMAGKPSGKPEQYYNDIQCGNGPANKAPDEKVCPGIAETGGGDKYSGPGCNKKGPKWDLGGGAATEEPLPAVEEPAEPETGVDSDSDVDTDIDTAPEEEQPDDTVVETPPDDTAASPAPPPLGRTAPVAPVSTPGDAGDTCICPGRDNSR